MTIDRQRMIAGLTLLALALVLTPASFASELRVTITDTDGQPVHNAVIEITEPDIPVPDHWEYQGVMDQIDKEFVETVLLVVRGSVVTFPNSDDILHHVYSFSDRLSFELPLYMGDSADLVKFDHAGVAVLGCNIHDWMLGYIYVGESHLIARSNEEGRATLTGLDPGSYSFRVWHPQAVESALAEKHTVTVNRDGVTAHNITVDLNSAQFIRRAPGRAGRGYRSR